MRRFFAVFFFGSSHDFRELVVGTPRPQKKKLYLHHLIQVMQVKEVKCVTEVNYITRASELWLHQRRCRSEVTKDADPSKVSNVINERLCRRKR